VAVTYEIEIAGRMVSVSVRPEAGGGYRVAIDGGPERIVHAGRLGAAEWWLRDDRGRRSVAVHVERDVVSAQVGGHGLLGTILDPRSRVDHGGGVGEEGVVKTPIPGAVARVLVASGDRVHQGQVLVVVEAMKMENEFRSPFDGVVTAVHATAGTTVEGNTVLVVVEAEA
jgi:biotin carboxyl carrier protein